MINKKIIIIVSILIVLAVVTAFSLTALSVHSSLLSKDDGCLSITLFEKRKLADVDRVVIDKRDRRCEITDKDLIDDIINETSIATHATSGVHGKDYTIELYSGDELVRSMPWASCCDIVTVYTEDATHWLFNLWVGKAKVGYVYLSQELVDVLEGL